MNCDGNYGAVLADIEPCHEMSSNCIEDVFATLVRWRNCDCSLLFSNSWSFKYRKKNRNNKLLGTRIDIYRNGFAQLEEALQRFYGIKVHWRQVDDYQKTIHTMKKEITKCMPVGIGIDSFWCSWNKGYRTYHMPHYCLVVGILDTGIVCVDSHLSPKKELLSFKDYQQGCKNYCTFSFKLIKNTEDWKQVVLDSTAKLLKCEGSGNDFEKMRDCAEEIRHYTEIENEFLVYPDIGIAPIILKLGYISYGRKNYTKALLYFHKKNNAVELKNYAGKINEAGLKWWKIKNLLVKYYTSGSIRNKLEALSNKITEAAGFEENLAQEMVRFIRDMDKKERKIIGKGRIS